MVSRWRRRAHDTSRVNYWFDRSRHLNTRTFGDQESCCAGLSSTALTSFSPSQSIYKKGDDCVSITIPSNQFTNVRYDSELSTTSQVVPSSGTPKISINDIYGDNLASPLPPIPQQFVNLYGGPSLNPIPSNVIGLHWAWACLVYGCSDDLASHGIEWPSTNFCLARDRESTSNRCE